MSDRSDVFAVLKRYKDGFDEYDDEKIRSCFAWPCTVLTNSGAISIHEPPVTTAQMKALKELASDGQLGDRRHRIVRHEGPCCSSQP